MMFGGALAGRGSAQMEKVLNVLQIRECADMKRFGERSESMTWINKYDV